MAGSSQFPKERVCMFNLTEKKYYLLLLFTYESDIGIPLTVWRLWNQISYILSHYLKKFTETKQKRVQTPKCEWLLSLWFELGVFFPLCFMFLQFLSNFQPVYNAFSRKISKHLHEKAHTYKRRKASKTTEVFRLFFLSRKRKFLGSAHYDLC